jgi:hypothetical protein
MNKLTALALCLICITISFILCMNFKPSLSELEPDAESREAERLQTQDISADKSNAEIEAFKNAKGIIADKSSKVNNVVETQCIPVDDNTRGNDRLAKEHEELKERFEKLNGEFSRTNRDLFTAQDLLKQAGLQQPGGISAKRAKELLPPPFDKVMTDTTGTSAQVFNKLHNANEDFAWGADMELQIRDFVVTHEFANFVELESVICRDSICEIRGFQDDNYFWSNKVSQDIFKMPFWKFNSVSSRTGSVPQEDDASNDEEDKASDETMKNYFYVLASLEV